MNKQKRDILVLFFCCMIYLLHFAQTEEERNGRPTIRTHQGNRRMVFVKPLGSDEWHTTVGRARSKWRTPQPRQNAQKEWVCCKPTALLTTHNTITLSYIYIIIIIIHSH